MFLPTYVLFFQYETDENRTFITITTRDRSVLSNLVINVAMMNDAGEYVCNASSPVYNTVSTNPITVFVQGEPILIMVYNY